uniref:App1 family protein n=2 Tax=Kocuria sp. HSID16901 TaxID=2419505 RepID=UPI001575460C|nr:phosphatase domain-containing protein [Kocuria sp. HSID16901]
MPLSRPRIRRNYAKTRRTPSMSREAVNLGYRIADGIHERREKAAIKAGNEPAIVPFVGYGSTQWVRVLGRALYKTMLFSELSETFSGDQRASSPARGWRSFTSVPISYAEITVTIGGQQFQVSSDRGGVLDVSLDIDLEPGVHEVTMSMEGSETVSSSVYVVPEDENIGIICDVDDTVMVTALPRPLLAAWNSFVLSEHARMPTPGMPVLLERIHRAHPTSPVMYLSTGAWNVAPTLRRFLSRNAYPEGTLLLTDWGPTRTRWFRSGAAHKVNSLRRLAREFPDMKWILIGDDGQSDPDIYNGFALRYPEHVAAIIIRNLTVGESVLASGRVWGDDRAREIAAGSLWMEANDGATLCDKLKRTDLL